jgi:hypothetical protein
MIKTRNPLTLLALSLFTVAANAAPLVYALSSSQGFGTIDLTNGAFHQFGPTPLEPSTGLTPGPNGSLLTLSVSGNLDSIDPATGVTTLIGPTGLGDCTTAASPCGPNSADNLVEFGGKIYATDLANNLYTLNPFTGAATLIGPTGIPPLPFVLLATNPDGSINAVDQALFSSGGKLYATFDAITIDFSTSTITPVIPNALYQIDPATGVATMIAPTALNLSAAVDVNGTVYAFNAATSQLVTLNLTSGATTFVADIDPSVGLVIGASATPEPASIAFVGVGMTVIIIIAGRRRRSGVVENLRGTK